MFHPSNLSNTASNTINALVFAGVITIADAEFITARRGDLEHFESSGASKCPRERDLQSD